MGHWVTGIFIRFFKNMNVKDRVIKFKLVTIRLIDMIDYIRLLFKEFIFIVFLLVSEVTFRSHLPIYHIVPLKSL